MFGRVRQNPFAATLRQLLIKTQLQLLLGIVHRRKKKKKSHNLENECSTTFSENKIDLPCLIEEVTQLHSCYREQSCKSRSPVQIREQKFVLLKFLSQEYLSQAVLMYIPYTDAYWNEMCKHHYPSDVKYKAVLLHSSPSQTFKEIIATKSEVKHSTSSTLKSTL